MLDKLFEPFENSLSTAEVLCHSIVLLVSLEVDTTHLSQKFLEKSFKSVESLESELSTSDLNIVDHVTKVCEYLAELSVQVQSYKNIFSTKILQCPIKAQHAHEALKLHINDLLLEITEIVSIKLGGSEMTDDQLRIVFHSYHKYKW